MGEVYYRKHEMFKIPSKTIEVVKKIVIAGVRKGQVQIGDKG